MNAILLNKKNDIPCFYCKKLTKKGNGLTLDHVIPKSLGGNNNKKNLVCCCRKCNEFKSNKLLQEWLMQIDLMINGQIEIINGFDKYSLGQIRKSIKTLLNEITINELVK